MLSNTKWRVFAFNRTTGAPVTGDSANITAKLAIDYGTATALTDANPVEVEDGYYYFDLTTIERTGQFFELFPESSTSNVQVIGVPGYLASVSSGGSSGGRGGTYRRTTDLSPVLFTFPTGGLPDGAFTKTVRIDGGSPSNVTGAISYLYQIGGKHWYRLAYNAADRPASGADGVVQYVVTDGTDTVVVGLVVGGAAIASQTNIIGTSGVLPNGLTDKINLIGTDGVLPNTAILQPSNAFILQRVTATGVRWDVEMFVGETRAISIPSADYRAETLEAAFEDAGSNRPVAYLANADVIKEELNTGFVPPLAVRNKVQKLRYSIRRVSDKEVLLYGNLSVHDTAWKQ